MNYYYPFYYILYGLNINQYISPHNCLIINGLITNYILGKRKLRSGNDCSPDQEPGALTLSNSNCHCTHTNTQRLSLVLTGLTGY